MQNPQRPFVTMLIDSGTFSGRMGNIQYDMGGWPVYLFRDHVVFMTMPGKSRAKVVTGVVVKTLVEGGALPGPNKEVHKIVRETQYQGLAQAAEVFEQRGLDHVTAHDLAAIPGAVIVPTVGIRRVRISRTGLLRRAGKLEFEMFERDPDVPFYARTRYRRYTLGSGTPREQTDSLIQALHELFDERFENYYL